LLVYVLVCLSVFECKFSIVLYCIVLHLHPFPRDSLLKCVLHPKNREKFTKTPILGVHGRLRS